MAINYRINQDGGQAFNAFEILISKATTTGALDSSIQLIYSDGLHKGIDEDILFVPFFNFLRRRHIQIVEIEDGIEDEHVITMTGIAPQRIESEHHDPAFTDGNI